MKINLIGLTLLLFLLLSSITCLAQFDSSHSTKHKTSIGGWYTQDKHVILIGSYSFLQKRENEFCLSITFYSPRAFVFGSAFYYSVFKKKSKIDLFISGDIFVNYDWQTYNYLPKTTFWHCGPFLGLGILPTYNFSNRVSLSIKTNIGYGYQWAKEYEIRRNNYVYYRSSESGWYGLFIYGLELNYKF